MDNYRTLYKAWKNGTLTPEQYEALEDMGFFDVDEEQEQYDDTPSLEDLGLYLGSYES